MRLLIPLLIVIVKVEGNRAQIDAIALDGHRIETGTLKP
jgi:hypothetical protein